MTYFKRNYQIVLMISTIFISFTSAPHDPERLKKCLEGMKKIFVPRPVVTEVVSNRGDHGNGRSGGNGGCGGGGGGGGGGDFGFGGGGGSGGGGGGGWSGVGGWFGGGKWSGSGSSSSRTAAKEDNAVDIGDLSPLDCVKHAIKFLQLAAGDIETDICYNAKNYYTSFEFEVNSDGIDLPYNWCQKVTNCDATLMEKCVKDLIYFSLDVTNEKNKNAVVVNALYYTMQGSPDLYSSAHDKSSFGFDYLNHIHDNVMLKDDKMFDPVGYCNDLYGESPDPLLLV